MKNIHVIPTDKPSRLHLWSDKDGTRLELCEIEYSHTRNTQHIYITNDKKIKEGDYCIDGDDIYGPFEEGDIATVKFIKIILTTDEQLIRYGIQHINDEFLEWFVKNPSCEEIGVNIDYSKSVMNYSYKIIIPKEEPEQETLEEGTDYHGRF